MPPLFEPFRALGHITEETPYAVQRRGKETFVTVSVGSAWQVYNCSKLKLALVGPELPGRISALASSQDLTFAAVGSTICECTRLRRSGSYSGHDADVIQILVLGNVLLSLGKDRKLIVWRTAIYNEPEVVIPLGDDFQPTCMAHPDTYLNKVVVGGTSGKIQLWNFSTGKKLYTFDVAECRINCLASSPALDVVGIGLADGRAILHNLKFDKKVAVFSNASGAGAKNTLFLSSMAQKQATSECTTLSFRTGTGIPLMAAGGTSGVITVWNLEERRVHTIIRDAHDAALLSLHFFAGEPRLMSSAADNSIKQWLFDAPDNSARLLRFRSGHSKPPAVVRYYGDGTRLLSAGKDRAFRMFSVIQDQQSRELSQGKTASKARRLKIEEAELKLPPVTDVAACQVRERDWANVITAHEGDSLAYTWRLQHFTISEHVLKPAAKRRKLEADPLSPSPVTSVAISSCGNFGFVGTANGRVDRYNMQSGMHRGSYSRAKEGKLSKNAHDGEIRGLSSDACNHNLITSGQDGWLRIWNFKQQSLKYEVHVGSPIMRLSANPSTALVAIAAADHVLRVYDIETGRKVRTFAGHTDAITDMSISADGRWLLSSSKDGTFRIWDIPSARTLQVMQLGSEVASFSLSPAQELLATVHSNNTGIFLWANQFIYKGAAEITPSDVPVSISAPSIAVGGASCDDDDKDESRQEALETHSLEASPAALGGEAMSEGIDSASHPAGPPAPLLPQLVTMSMLPKSQWQNLIHLDAIKERSKPTQPPKKPEAAPFFLPTVATLSKQPIFDAGTDSTAAAAPEGNLPNWGEGNEADVQPESKKKRKGKKIASTSRVLQSGSLKNPASAFVLALRQGDKNEDFEALIRMLRDMSPVAVDQEIQSMQVVDIKDADPEELADLQRLMKFIELEVEAGRSFEHVQAILKAFLNTNGSSILEDEKLTAQAQALHNKLCVSWERLEKKLLHVRCLVNFLGNMPS